MVTQATLKAFTSVICRNRTLVEVLQQASRVFPTEQPWYLIGGSIYQTVWNVISRAAAAANIGDYDLVYFDRGSGVRLQQLYQGTITAAVAAKQLRNGGTVKIDVKNQALITAAWYKQAFRRQKDTSPYRSLEDSIAKAYVSSPVVGVTWQLGELRVLAIADFEKLLELKVYPNNKFRTKRIMPFYRKKATKWHDLWPNVTVHDWVGAPVRDPRDL